MILQTSVFVSAGNESVEISILMTHPHRVAEKKGRPEEVYLGVPRVILSLQQRFGTDVPLLGLAVQEQIRLVGWRIKQRQIVFDVDMIVKEPFTFGKWKMQEGKG
ncbi:hypothetical protein V6N11_063681 [Hibiscus sabdariffa]